MVPVPESRPQSRCVCVCKAKGYCLSCSLQGGVSEVKQWFSEAVLQSPALAWPGLAPPRPVTYMEQKTQAILSWGINTTVRHPVSTHWGWEALMALLNPQQKTLNTHSTPASDLYLSQCTKSYSMYLKGRAKGSHCWFYPESGRTVRLLCPPQ